MEQSTLEAGTRISIQRSNCFSNYGFLVQFTFRKTFSSSRITIYFQIFEPNELPFSLIKKKTTATVV